MLTRLRGGLAALTDSEQRPLRPVGCSVREAAARTGVLLARLREMPGVRVCDGVRVGTDGPPLGFAVTAGALVLLVESVAWPAGAYRTGPDGRVFCDDLYIGQSVRPLMESARRLRGSLPDRHRVGAVIVVHPYGPGPATLPAPAAGAPAWLRPGDAAGFFAARLRRPAAGR